MAVYPYSQWVAALCRIYSSHQNYYHTNECFTSTLHFSLPNHLTSFHFISFQFLSLFSLQFIRRHRVHRLQMEFCNHTPQMRLPYHLIMCVRACVRLLVSMACLPALMFDRPMISTKRSHRNAHFYFNSENVCFSCHSHILNSHTKSLEIAGEVASWEQHQVYRIRWCCAM